MQETEYILECYQWLIYFRQALNAKFSKRKGIDSLLTPLGIKIVEPVDIGWTEIYFLCEFKSF